MKEGEFLLAAFRDASELHASSLSKLDLSVLQTIAESHGVFSLLCDRFGRNLPQELESRMRELSVRSLEYQHEIHSLQKSFQERGVDVLFFKGSSLAFTAYKRPELRTLNDIDLLVQQKDVDATHALLLELGYEIGSIHSERELKSQERFQDTREYFREDRQITVDLHWKLLKDFYSIPFSPESIFRDAVPVPTPLGEIRTFSSEDHFLFLCLHGSKHTWNELKWILDIGEMLKTDQAIDLRRVLERSKRIGASRMVLLGLALARDIAGIHLDSFIEKEIQAENTVAELKDEIRDLLVRNEMLDVPGTISADLKLRSRTIDKIQYFLRRTLTPHAEDWKTFGLPDFAYPLYYILRPIRLLWRYAVR